MGGDVGPDPRRRHSEKIKEQTCDLRRQPTHRAARAVGECDDPEAVVRGDEQLRVEAWQDALVAGKAVAADRVEKEPESNRSHALVGQPLRLKHRRERRRMQHGPAAARPVVEQEGNEAPDVR